jgi:hypothetical protein
MGDAVPLIVQMLCKLEGERVTEVLPALHTMEIRCGRQASGARSKTLGLLVPFLAAREEAGHPVVVDFVPYI